MKLMLVFHNNRVKYILMIRKELVKLFNEFELSKKIKEVRYGKL